MLELERDEAARARALVPSEREVEAGVVVAADEPRRAAGPEEDARPQISLRGIVRDLRPRAVLQGAPATPLVVMSLFVLVAQWDDHAFGVLLPDMRGDFAFDLQFLLTMNAVIGSVSFALLPVLGFLADHASRVWMIRTGALVSNAGSIAVGLTRGLPGLVLGRAGTQLGTTLQQPAALPLLSDVYPSATRARVFAFIGVAGSIGTIAGPAIGGNLGVAYGWRVAIVVLGCLSILVSVLAFFMREPARGYQDRLELGASPEEAARAQPPVGWGESWRAARSIATVRRFWWSAPFTQATAVIGFQLTGLYYAEQFGLDARARGYITAANAVLGLAGLLLAGPLADRLLAFRPGRVLTLMGLGLVLQAGCTMAFVFSPWAPLSIAINLPVQFVNALFLPATLTMLTLTVPARFRGLGIQTIAPWQLLGAIVFGPLLGFLADNAGLRAAFLAVVPLHLIAAAILGTGGSAVARDIRSARIASLAEEEVRASRAGAILVCRGVDVAYDGVQVLFGVDLDVAEGEILALLGTNGAGKSTMLRAIAGVQEAAAGAIFFDGRDITHVPPHQNAQGGIVLVPGGRAIFPSLTVEENLRAAGGTADEALAFFPELRERLALQAGNLSGGEQQMLALAQAFLMRPRLLMIDELSLGLAPAIVERLLEILRAIHGRGTTVVLVEQSINVALTIAQRAVFLEKCAVVYDGPTEELLHRSDVVRSVFLGSSAGRGGLVRAQRRKQKEAVAGEALLEAAGLRARFGGVTALDGAGVEVRAGEIVGVIGPNGAGKTTLFDAISGTIDLDEGTVRFEGLDITLLEPDARARLGLGRSFQTARLFPTLTARETIAAALERHLDGESALGAAAWSPKVRRLERRTARRADSLIELLGLEPYADRFCGELSTATRRVVDLACSLAFAPRVLLLDEPSSGLSQSEAEELGPLLERLVRETGCGLLVVEHDIPLVTSVSHRLVAMQLGAVLVTGAPADVVAHPEVERSYLGTTKEAVARSGRLQTPTP